MGSVSWCAWETCSYFHRRRFFCSKDIGADGFCFRLFFSFQRSFSYYIDDTVWKGNNKKRNSMNFFCEKPKRHRNSQSAEYHMSGSSLEISFLRWLTSFSFVVIFVTHQRRKNARSQPPFYEIKSKLWSMYQYFYEKQPHSPVSLRKY